MPRTTNQRLESLRARLYPSPPTTAAGWLPLLRRAGDDPVAMDYLRAHGCKYKSASTCQGAATRVRRARFRREPFKHLTPETAKEYRWADSIPFSVAVGLVLTGYGIIPGLFLKVDLDQPYKLAWMPPDAEPQKHYSKIESRAHDLAREAGVPLFTHIDAIWYLPPTLLSPQHPSSPRP